MREEAQQSPGALPSLEPYPSPTQLQDLRQELERVCPTGVVLDNALVEGIFWDLEEGRFATAQQALDAALACRQRCQALTPPYEHLKRLAETSPPPAEWFQEDAEGLF